MRAKRQQLFLLLLLFLQPMGFWLLPALADNAHMASTHTPTQASTGDLINICGRTAANVIEVALHSRQLLGVTLAFASYFQILIELVFLTCLFFNGQLSAAN